MNRLSFGYVGLSASSHWVKWRIADVAALVVVAIVNVPVYYQKPFQRQFYINDLSISHPYATNQRINDKMLFVISFLVPFGAILAIWALLADKRHRWYLLYISLLGLCLTWSLTTLFTNFIKNWIGRLRPDFLARCEPRDGLPLDTLLNAEDVCTTQNTKRFLDGFRTTPSGHSSESFAGLGYLYLWLCGQLITEHPETGIWRKITAFVPILGATLIALSRTQDYRHHFIDVILGSILGYVFAHYIYRRYFPALDSSVPFKPLLDDSDVNEDSLYMPHEPLQTSGTESLTA
ncbi:DPP1 (YDR284C) [Zygosaccharomyces parabailii]|nr:DPP1 (YDR284C) [Zygosaccharomyces parabailii]